MFKFISVMLITMFFCSFSQAADRSVKITSFYYSDQNSRVAELCGQISGVETYPVYVKVTVDPRHNPGNYSVTALSEKFCTTVITRTGLANVELF